nr:MAG TPA: hypothetical protein [Caudoviricetes sp.]
MICRGENYFSQRAEWLTRGHFWCILSSPHEKDVVGIGVLNLRRSAATSCVAAEKGGTKSVPPLQDSLREGLQGSTLNLRSLK